MPHLHIVLTEQEDRFLKQSTSGTHGAQAKLVKALLWRFWREQRIVETIVKVKNDEPKTS